MIKICLVTDAWKPVWGGGQSHIWNLATKLVNKKDCQVTILVPNIRVGNEEYDKCESYFEGNLKVIRVAPSYVFPNFIGRTAFAIISAGYVLGHSYDIVHSHSYPTCLSLILKKIFSPQTKIFFTPHGGGFNILGGGILNYLAIPKILDFIVRRLIPYDGLVGVLPSDISGFSVARSKKVIGNGVDPLQFINRPPKKRSHGLVFLNVGRLVPVKNQDNLIRAFAKLVSIFPNASLTIIGEGELFNNLKKLIFSLKLDEKVFLKKAVPMEQMPRVYKEADVFILPSIFEGQPISLLEAMSSSLPAIVSGAGQAGQIVEQSGCGLVTTGYDSESILNSMRKIHDMDNATIKKMGELGRKWVMKNASWDNLADKTYDFYTLK